MIQAFINTDKTLEKFTLPTNNTASEYEKIKHTLTGHERAVKYTIQVLHQLGYANINEWSPLLPSSNPGEVISVLTRSIIVR